MHAHAPQNIFSQCPKQILQNLAIAFIFAVFLTQPSFAVGGTNGLLDRMEGMVYQMSQTQEMSSEDVIFYEKKIRALRQKVDERIKESGGINPIKDKDLYDEIDSFNKPIFDSYQKSNAKTQYDPRRMINK
ncbi:MAG: hypothetical protein K2X66_06255 [Cyanobacteria bacterium]|nr:hypothetical protein [Cyanobacteriota bacterium]